MTGAELKAFIASLPMKAADKQLITNLPLPMATFWCAQVRDAQRRVR